MVDLIKVQDIEIEVIRKAVKNINFRIYPSGKVRISVPLSASQDDIENAISKKISWISAKRVDILNQKHSQSSFMHHRDTISIFGEHKKVSIDKCSNRNVVLEEGNAIKISVKSYFSDNAIESLLLGWYRQRLSLEIESRSKHWENLIGVRINEWKIRKMKTRWGSCNIQKRRIWLNLELAALSVCCLDYVMVHEITHLFERYHNARFYSLLNEFYPSWEEVRQYMKRQSLQLQ